MKNSNSLTTGLLKLTGSLKNKKTRDKNNLFLVEGYKLCYELYKSKYNTKFLVLKNEASASALELSDKFIQKKVSVFFTNEKTFNRICDTVSPQDILAVVGFRNDEHLPNESFIALDQISDPGNIGTIIRTAEWFGFRQVILSESCADKYNPKLVRATMGSLLKLKVVTGINFEKSLKILFPNHELFGASLETENKMDTIKVKGKFGLVFGSESHGISKKVRKILTKEFIIPGANAESLNVAVASGISMYYFNKMESNSSAGMK
jgi:TrmH family RNA methyltransferase